MNWLRNYSVKTIVKKVGTRILPNVRYMHNSRIRQCECCQRPTIFLSLGPVEEFIFCLRCRANKRYEMIARHLRKSHWPLTSKSVLELDPASPLKKLLEVSGEYIPSFFRPDCHPGALRLDGVRCEDITALTFADASLDLIISSDVLEHVPDIHKAFSETARVLKSGGSHIFTVPPRQKTFRRAELLAGQINHLVSEPEYHGDPLDSKGILCFWDLGEDLNEVFGNSELTFSVVVGPEGDSGRIVWSATRLNRR